MENKNITDAYKHHILYVHYVIKNCCADNDEHATRGSQGVLCKLERGYFRTAQKRRLVEVTYS